MRTATAAEPRANNETRAAREHYERGQRLFDIGDWAAALDAFQQAYTAKPDPALLFNIAQCRRKLGELDEALRLYRTYVKREERPARRREVERIIEEVEQQKAASTVPAPLPSLAPTVPSRVAVAAAAPAAPSPWYKRPWVWGAAALLAVGVTVAIIASAGSEPARLPTTFCGECTGGTYPIPVSGP